MPVLPQNSSDVISDTQECSPESQQVFSSNSRRLSKDAIICLSLAAGIFVVTMLWYQFDYRVLSPDEAGHVLSSMMAGDLLLHAKPWQHQWWYQAFTVSNFYPPFCYFFAGAIGKICGDARLGVKISSAVFLAALAASIYLITRLSKESRLAAISGAFCVVSYPIVSGLSHSAFLDLPATAMISLALLAMLWWRNSTTVDLRKTLVVAVVTGLACLTKQTAVCFLLPAGMYFVGRDLMLLFRARSGAEQFSGETARQWLVHDLLFALMTALLFLPFVIINFKYLNGYVHISTVALANKGVYESFSTNLIEFCKLLPDATSPLLVALFLLSLFTAGKKIHHKLLPLSLSSIGGLSILCLSHGIVHDYRYILPMLIAPAVYSGIFLNQVLTSKVKLIQLAAAGFLVLLVYSCVTLTFSPYPVNLPMVWKPHFPYYCKPTEALDWGYDSVIDTIGKSGSKHSLLNILVNSDAIHINGYRLKLAERKNFEILPCGSRFYTITGDQVTFSPEKALEADWYLWKTGPSGYTFYDENSRQAYDQLVNFVINSSNYKLALLKRLPDATDLMLFRKRR